ncbi:MAG TPA: hypothetical protein VGR62_25340 [Candidatus Binatia bacterium]|nr:hypothetical protein [Candidatus Binatia bacterium]
MSDVPAAVRRGMAAQLASLDEHLALGMPRVGWKVAVNDPAMQRRLGLDGWVTGFLRGDRVVPAGGRYDPPDGGMILVEAELAIRLARDVPPDATPAVAAAAITGVAPAIEIVDYARSTAGVDAILAHSVFHDAVVFGDESTSSIGAATLRRGDEVVRTADRVLDPGPLDVLVARVAVFLGVHGAALLAGDRIISGTFTQPWPVAAGDTVSADFGPRGAVSVRIG